LSVLALASLRFNAHKTGPDFSATSENLSPANGHSSEGIPQAAAQHCLHNRARLKQGKGTEAPPPASTRDPRPCQGLPNSGVAYSQHQPGMRCASAALSRITMFRQYFRIIIISALIGDM
jgi:hypothetical protein